MNTLTKINSLTPAFAIHPGEMLADELKERNINQKDFAALIGVAKTQFNEVIKGKRSINAELALVIGKALNMDASIWMNLQNNYDLDKAKIQEKSKRRIEAIDTWQMIESFIPVSFFKKQTILSGNPIDDLNQIKQVYNLTHFDELPTRFSQAAFAHFRKSEKLTSDKVNLVGWAHLVQYKASMINVESFNSISYQTLIDELKVIFKKNKNTEESCKLLLAENGIKLIQQTTPDKCAVDGISFWSNGKPAIGMSLRHKRIDNFAFTLMHELGHVYLHLTSNNQAQFIDIEKQEKNEKEREADNFASNCLIDSEDWDNFLFEKARPNDNDFKIFAKQQNIHPAIVLGRYCHFLNKFNLSTSIDKSLN